MSEVELPPLPAPYRQQGQQLSSDGYDKAHCDLFSIEQMREYALVYGRACALAERERLKDGPMMRRGEDGNGKPWMGTMRECLEDAKGAARVEARLAREMRDERNAERDRCAKIAQAAPLQCVGLSPVTIAEGIAAAIRAEPQP
ncbi:MAG TPA: hypothetical protein VD994_04660 [Prosthecobacter sp.]|nr:hypothetical protein [Prosthecobacter sp.]